MRIFIFGLIFVLLGCAYVIFSKQAPVWKSYTNEKYGYSIKVPQELFVNTYNNDDWSISSNINLRVYPDTELTIKNSFESFISLPEQIGCNADSEDVSSQCDKILQIDPYENALGLKGYIYFINQILTYHKENKTINNKWGPIYAFDISKLTNYDQRALIISPTFSPGPGKTDEELLKVIVDSLKFK